MTDKPIIFSAPMVRALLDGRKTQTRRVLKPQPHERAKGCYLRPDGSWVWLDAHRQNNGVGYFGNRLDDRHFLTPYAPGDRLYVRETWLTRGRNPEGGWELWDYAEGAREHQPDWVRKMTSIHMPRWASRLTLTVTDVRVQRLQDIIEADAVAEGCGWSDVWEGFTPCPEHGDARYFNSRSACASFERLWSGLHGPDAWDANPWVVALTFTVEQRNIDADQP